nr:ATP-binding protein [Ardenticatena sp.]
MPITRIRLEHFTAFHSLDFHPASGLNVLIGANGTGKTHLMKVAYAACDVSKTKKNLAEKLVRVYLPSNDALGRLVHRQRGRQRCSVEISSQAASIRISFSSHATSVKSARIEGATRWAEHPIESVYIPVKEMLANAPGFRALYAQREIHFEEIYADILDRAYLPPLRGRPDRQRQKLLGKLQKVIQGKVVLKNEEFFLRNRRGELEFTLLAEGMRKLGLLWVLLQNGTLLEGAVLFWDEPETNLNPSLFRPLVHILLELQRLGTQIFLATHDYVILKEIDLQKRPDDDVLFHALYRNEEDRIMSVSATEYASIHPNAIAETFSNLYEREIERLVRGTE